MIFALFLLSLLRCGSLSASVVNEVVAVVNDEVITQNEVDIALIPVYAQLKSTRTAEEMKTPEVFDKLNEARETILEELIENKLVVQEARKANAKVDEYEVEDMLNDIKRKFASNEEFEEVIKSQGITIESLKQKYTEQIMARKIMGREVRSKVFVSPSEVTAYYNGHIDEFQTPEEVRVSNILIREDLTKGVFSESRGLADRIYGMLKKGDDFAVLAKKYSQGPNAANGGDMGFVKRGQLMRQIDVELFKLNPGEITPVIHTDLGYHIFKVGERKPVRIKMFDEVKEEIRSTLFAKKAAEKYKEWIEKLKKNAYIEVKKK